MTDSTVYWLWLAGKTAIPLKKRRKLAWAFDHPRKIYKASFDELAKVRILSHQELTLLAKDKSLSTARAAEAFMKKWGISLITRLDLRYPSALREMEDAPAWFFMQGDSHLLGERRSVFLPPLSHDSLKTRRSAEQSAQSLSSCECPVVALYPSKGDEPIFSAALRRGSLIVYSRPALNLLPDEKESRLFRLLRREGLVLSESFFDEQGEQDERRREISIAVSLAGAVFLSDFDPLSIQSAKRAKGLNKSVFFSEKMRLNAPQTAKMLMKDGAQPIVNMIDLTESMRFSEANKRQAYLKETQKIDLDQPIAAFLNEDFDSPGDEQDKNTKDTAKERRPKVQRVGLAGLSEQGFDLLMKIRQGCTSVEKLRANGYSLSSLQNLLTELEEQGFIHIEGMHILLQ